MTPLISSSQLITKGKVALRIKQAECLKKEIELIKEIKVELNSYSELPMKYPYITAPPGDDEVMKDFDEGVISAEQAAEKLYNAANTALME